MYAYISINEGWYVRDKTREAMRFFLGGRCYTAENLEKDYLAEVANYSDDRWEAPQRGQQSGDGGKNGCQISSCRRTTLVRNAGRNWTGKAHLPGKNQGILRPDAWYLSGPLMLIYAYISINGHILSRFSHGFYWLPDRWTRIAMLRKSR